MVGRSPILILMPCTGGEAAEERMFAQGITDDLQVELARFHSLQLMCWATPDSGEALARLLPSGSEKVFILRTGLRRLGEALRVTATLTEAQSERSVWSERYDIPLRELFAVEDSIVGRTAVALAARLEDLVLHGARGKPLENLEAYELWLHGKALLLQGTLEGDEAAREVFQHALKLDASFPRAYAGLSLSYFNEWTCQVWDFYDANAQKAYEYAHAALALDDTDPLLHLVIGRILLYRRHFDQGAWYMDRALALSPHDTDCLIQLSLCYSMLGNHELSIQCAEKALQLRPFHPNWYCAYAIFPFLLARRVDEALALSRKSVALPMVDLPACLAICHALKGEMAEARHWFAQFETRFSELIVHGRQPHPGEAVDWMLAVNPVRNEADVNFIREGFNQIGVEPTRPGNEPPQVREPGPAQGAFIRKGASWLLEYAGQTALMPDMKGLRDIVSLLERPGAGVHCFDLSGHVRNSSRDESVLDEKARSAYQARLRELQEEIADAQDANDLGLAEQLQAEMDLLLETLAGALGLGGRSRRLGSMAERARSTVTWRIRYAIRKVEGVHAALGRHLRKAVRTGMFCSYEPETPVNWRLSAQIQDAASLTEQ